MLLSAEHPVIRELRRCGVVCGGSGVDSEVMCSWKKAIQMGWMLRKKS